MLSLYVLMDNFKPMIGFDEIVLKFCLGGIIVRKNWNLLLVLFLFCFVFCLLLFFFDSPYL